MVRATRTMEPAGHMDQDEPQHHDASSSEAAVHVHTSLSEIDAQQWNALANPPGQPFHPFITHEFLIALEETGCVGGHTGWRPCHLTVENEAGALTAAAPCYLKSHSQGEYIFDQGWAEAYEQAGGRYYPKLLIAVPFTPVPGPRFLVRDDASAAFHRHLLAAGAMELAKRNALSSVHANFLEPDIPESLQKLGFITRLGQQFHWHNDGYHDFDDFLNSLASRKRKAIRKERSEAVANDITIEHITGDAITEAHWDAMFAFYQDTGARKWGRPYLNRAFFSALGARMNKHCLLIFAKRDNRYVAGALNMIGSDCLYGRYWGAIEHHPHLHFEICYYQAIEYAITNGLARVEAGAQGEHKIARGYRPVETLSSHWLADPALRHAVSRFVDRERRAVSDINAALCDLGPYRRGS